MEFAKSILSKKYIQSYIQNALWSLSKGSPVTILDENVIIQKPRKTQKAIPKKMLKKHYKKVAVVGENIEYEYNPIEPDKKRCPKGSSAIIVDGVKMCRKKKIRNKLQGCKVYNSI